MSISHNFYIDREVESFSKDLIDDIQGLISKNKAVVEVFEIDNEHIYVGFRTQRPGCFYLTTNPEHAVLKMAEKALFSFMKYNNGKENDMFCRIALICKYHLGELLTISSDDFYDYIGCCWENAEQYLNDNGYDIKLKWNEEFRTADTYINGEFVKNEFDRDNKIFKMTFKVFKPES